MTFMYPLPGWAELRFLSGSYLGPENICHMWPTSLKGDRWVDHMTNGVPRNPRKNPRGPLDTWLSVTPLVVPSGIPGCAWPLVLPWIPSSWYLMCHTLGIQRGEPRGGCQGNSPKGVHERKRQKVNRPKD